MENISLIKFSDSVLSSLDKHPNCNLISIQILLLDMYPFKKEFQEIQTIIDFLIEDKNVNFKDTSPIHGGTLHSDRIYSLTFKGKIFCEQGGYTQQKVSADAEKIRMETLERFQKQNTSRVTFLTFLIAVGTAVAAVYYGIEVYKHFCP